MNAPSQIAPNGKESKVRVETLARTLRTAAATIAGPGSPIAVRRRVGTLARLSPKSKAVRRRDSHLGGVPVRWFYPRTTHPATPIIMHFHGGGFCLCSSKNTHELFLSHLARHTGHIVVGVDYRLAPEHPFPVPILDCVNAYRGLVAEGVAPSDIVLTGDSAGGNLVLAVVQKLRAWGDPMPRALALMSPWVDMELKGETVDTHVHRDYLSRAVLQKFVDGYLQGADPRQSLASPCNADFTGLPPTLVQVGGAELMLSEIRWLACQAQSHGVDLELQEWPDMIHAWHGFSIVLPEAHSAFKAVGHFLDTRVGDGADVVRPSMPRFRQSAVSLSY